MCLKNYATTPTTPRHKLPHSPVQLPHTTTNHTAPPTSTNHHTNHHTKNHTTTTPTTHQPPHTNHHTPTTTPITSSTVASVESVTATTTTTTSATTPTVLVWPVEATQQAVPATDACPTFMHSISSSPKSVKVKGFPNFQKFFTGLFFFCFNFLFNFFLFPSSYFSCFTFFVFFLTLLYSFFLLTFYFIFSVLFLSFLLIFPFFLAACDCTGTAALGCNNKTSDCNCQQGVDMATGCKECSAGFYNYTSAGCTPCNCFLLGTLSASPNCSVNHFLSFHYN